MDGQAAEGSGGFGAAGGVEGEAGDVSCFDGGAQVESVGAVEDGTGSGFGDDS